MGIRAPSDQIRPADRRVRYALDDGRTIVVNVAGDVANYLRMARRVEQRHESWWAEHAKLATDLRCDVSQWAGPRASFGVLLGDSQRWDGPEADRDSLGRCRACGRLPDQLPASHYCLRCDRSGLDAFIPDLTAVELRRKRILHPLAAPHHGRVRRGGPVPVHRPDRVGVGAGAGVGAA